MFSLTEHYLVCVNNKFLLSYVNV